MLMLGCHQKLLSLFQEELDDLFCDYDASSIHAATSRCSIA